MSSRFQGRKFRELQAQWYAKLAAGGFRDIERGAEGRLPMADSTLRVSIRRARNSGRAEYFRRAGHWQHDAVWRSRLARRIWELHAEGMGYREICRALGPMRLRQPRRVLELLQREQAALRVVPPEPAEHSAHAQALEAEGFGYDGQDRPARATPIVDIDRAFRRRGRRLKWGLWDRYA